MLRYAKKRAVGYLVVVLVASLLTVLAPVARDLLHIAQHWIEGDGGHQHD